MMRLFFLAFCFSLVLLGFSQKPINRNSDIFLISDLSLQRMDAFWSIGLKKRVNYFELGITPGIGIEKTFFQRRFSPHLELFSFFNVIQQEVNRKKGIVFGPGLLFSGTSYRIENAINYCDLFLGYQFCYGNRIKFYHQGGYGLMFEFFDGNNGNLVNLSYNYFIKAGLSYALVF